MRLYDHLLISCYRILLHLRGIHTHDRRQFIGDDNALAAFLYQLKGDPLFQQSRRVAIYGAGKHTERIFSHAILPREKFTVIFDDAPKKESHCGLPVVSTSAAGHTHFDLLLISSDAFEAEMAAKAQSWLPRGVKLLPLYNPALSRR